MSDKRSDPDSELFRDAVRDVKPLAQRTRAAAGRRKPPARARFTAADRALVLVESLQKLRKTGGKLYLTQLQPRVKGLLEIARLDTIFVICADDAEAMGK